MGGAHLARVETRSRRIRNFPPVVRSLRCGIMMIKLCRADWYIDERIIRAVVEYRKRAILVNRDFINEVYLLAERIQDVRGIF